MNIRDLEYFLAVVELGHFGKAATACHVSQPTLSGQIKKLEEFLGVQLLERTNKRIMVTETGKQIASTAKYILREVDTIKEIARCAHDPLQGRFRLGAIPTLAAYVFPDLVKKIKSSLPELHLILIEEKTDQLMTKLLSGEVDAAILALPVDHDFLVSAELFADDFVLAVSPNHTLANKKSIPHEALAGQKLLLLEEGHCFRNQALEVCHQHHIDEQAFKATSLETLRQMVKAGTGITLMPEIATKDNEADICYIPFQAPAPKRTVGLVWRKTTPRLRVMEMLQKLLA